MKRYRRWLGCALLVCFSVITSAFAEMKVLKARYLGRAKDPGVYSVQAFGKGELPAEVRLTDQSDPASRAVFEKLVQTWLFRSDLAEVGIQHDATLTVTLVCEESGDNDHEPLPVALRGVQLELPFVIHVENMEEENYLAGSFLVDDAAVLFGGAFSGKECASFSKVDVARVAALEKRKRWGARSELVLYERAALQRVAMLRNRAEERKMKPSKLRQQVEELRGLLERLEHADGGCKVSELRAREGDFAFAVEVPSLAASGANEGDGVVIFSLVQAMDAGEWRRLRSENEKLFAESDAAQKQYLKLPADVRSGKLKPTAEQKQVLALRRDVADRLRHTFDVPMARYKNVGLVVMPPSAGKVGEVAAGATVEAQVHFYRKVSGLVEFYDLEDVIAKVRAAASERNGKVE